eukprot:GHVS01040080.1.p1 GENE.GHVS01040080.1~~GHVS01040080.1.p1  ORF type:complete len:220 (+),score=25.22 GHVS01040080.1:52-711(+)
MLRGFVMWPHLHGLLPMSRIHSQLFPPSAPSLLRIAKISMQVVQVVQDAISTHYYYCSPPSPPQTLPKVPPSTLYFHLSPPVHLSPSLFSLLSCPSLSADRIPSLPPCLHILSPGFLPLPSSLSTDCAAAGHINEQVTCHYGTCSTCAQHVPSSPVRSITLECISTKKRKYFKMRKWHKQKQMKYYKRRQLQRFWQYLPYRRKPFKVIEDVLFRPSRQR